VKDSILSHFYILTRENSNQSDVTFKF